jgi:toxin ParE1/3/4
MLRVHFDPAALAELHTAHVWYEAKSSGKGLEFVREVTRHIEHIEEWPEAARRVESLKTRREVRRSGLRTFPYGVVYFVTDDVLWIVAIAHGKRRPNYWRDRLR